ncbi:hypothetical protein HII13_004356 [Brettanomyces bruxellensis]|uniref:Pre-mRNA-splicing factor ISY1 n=1 Tax=Dekkera bruxellensis TaxID=5007 RepID=A0A7D9CX34_DEKBR|nr:hypothetical protein HII13_004356 [Brettanomyces bruxellensis]VUG17831.1 ISY1 [Brettanomyces bruxellensis]
MSRNKEKAQSLLNLYYAQKGPQIPTRRPRSTENVKSVTDAELFRKMCIQDIDKSLMKINNPLINEYEIRDLNSKLNKLFREKRAWEHRIKDLGGPDYLQFITNSNETIIKGCRYFGRAKELPDVQELLKLSREEKAENTQNFRRKKNRDESRKQLNLLQLDAGYYGLLDEDQSSQQRIGNGVLGIPSEEELLDEVKSTLGDKSLPTPIITRQELKHSLNPATPGSNRDDDIIKYERAVTRAASRRCETEAKPTITIPTEDFIADKSAVDKKVEKMIVAHKKKELLEKLGDI